MPLPTLRKAAAILGFDLERHLPVPLLVGQSFDVQRVDFLPLKVAVDVWARISAWNAALGFWGECLAILCFQESGFGGVFLLGPADFLRNAGLQ